MSKRRFVAGPLSAGSIMAIALLIASAPLSSQAAGPLPAPASARERSADISRALDTDGTFRGASGVAGTIDAGAWTLVSDLATGEAPRFAPMAGAIAPSAGGSWSGVGSNGSHNGALNNRVRAIAVSGTDLYVGGEFTDAAGIVTADRVAKWNGSTWSALGSNGAGNGALNNHYVFALAVSGSDLYVGGDFTDAAGIATADYVARWNGSAWSALGSNGAGNGALDSFVDALAVSGTNLYVGGALANVAGITTADYVAQWNGSTWSALGSNGFGDGAINSTVVALTASGTDLYAGGYFTDAAGILTADYVAKWNGGAWSALGSNGAGNGAIYGDVDALAVSGSDLYAGGNFADVAGIATADFVAKWNGSAWSALGSNGHGDGALNNWVHALAVSGSDLYVGGYFSDAAGIATADNVAKWNGSAWSGLGSNGSGGGAVPGDVEALAGSGPSIYVGGTFGDVAGVATADYLAKWGPSTVVVRKPDARISLAAGALLGDNVYNTTGAGQSKTGSAKKGKTITFSISIQNDGTSADRFKVKATGKAAAAYTVKYFAGTTDITAKVVAGTFRTPSLAPAAAYVITAKVTVKSSAKAGSKVTRLVTVTSAGNTAKKDAVTFSGKRA